MVINIIKQYKVISDTTAR